MKLAHLFTIPAAAIAILGLTAESAQSQVFSSNGNSGVYVQGNGQGFAGTFDGEGFQGILVGPDGKVQRLQSGSNPFRQTPNAATTMFRRNGAFAGAATMSGGEAMVAGGTPIGPGGFDPFSFVFGGQPRGGNVASMFAGPEPNEEISVAQRAFLAGRYSEALRFANRAVRVEPNNSDALQTQALALFALGEYDRAAAAAYDVLDRGVRWNWADVRAMYRDTETYVDQLRKLEEANARAESSAGLHFLLAYHYLMLDKSDNARLELEKTLQLQPENELAKELLEMLPPQID